MITKSELKKRQETADKVRDQLGEKAILNGRESDQNHSQYPPELRAIARASSGLKHWGEEDRSEDIHLFYEYQDSSPCTDRMLDYNTSIENAVLALRNNGKDGLALQIEDKWKKVQEFAEQADDTISVFRRQFINGNIDENTFAKKVRTAVHLARGTALALGRRLERVVKQQIEEFESKLSASGSKAGEMNKSQEKDGQAEPLKEPAKAKPDSALARNINIQNFQGILGDVQAENVQTGDYKSICKHDGIEKKKKGIIKKLFGIIAAVVAFLAALLGIFNHLGWLEPIKEFISRIFLHN